MTEGLKHWREIKEKTFFNGAIDYIIELNGTSYSVGMKQKDGTIEEYKQVDNRLLNLLEYLRNSKDRVRIWYGDRETGRAWNEEHNIMGTISRSGGADWKIPILVSYSRSRGGEGLWMSSIIRIDNIKEHRTLWKVDNFHIEEFNIKQRDDLEYIWEVEQLIEGKWVSVARFKTERQAQRWVDFMKGERYSK